MMNMHEAAVQQVEHHKTTCTNPECGCAEADFDEMVVALVELWLFGT